MAGAPPRGSRVVPSPGAVQGGQRCRKASPHPELQPGDTWGPGLAPSPGGPAMLTPCSPLGASPACGSRHSILSVHRCGCDWSSRHDVGPAAHCSGDPSGGTLAVPQGAQRVGKVGAGRGIRGAGGRDRLGVDCPRVGGRQAGSRVLPPSISGSGGCLEGQVIHYIPEAASNTQRAAGKLYNYGHRGDRQSRDHGVGAPAMGQGAGSSPGFRRNPKAESLPSCSLTHPPCAERGRWELGPQCSPRLCPHRSPVPSPCVPARSPSPYPRPSPEPLCPRAMAPGLSLRADTRSPPSLCLWHPTVSHARGRGTDSVATAPSSERKLLVMSPKFFISNLRSFSFLCPLPAPPSFPTCLPLQR